MSTDAEFVIHLVVTLLEEDPSKVIEAIDDAEAMKAVGADMGTSRHELMAEYCLYALKKVNTHIPELAELIDANEAEIEQGLIAHFVEKEW